jgi:hypothetical protein
MQHADCIMSRSGPTAPHCIMSLRSAVRHGRPPLSRSRPITSVAAGLLDALGLACNSLSAALEQQQQQQVSDSGAFDAVYSLSNSCLGPWSEWPVDLSQSDPGGAPGSEQLCSDRLDTSKHALLLSEASSPAAVLPAVARLTLAMLRIGVLR